MDSRQVAMAVGALLQINQQTRVYSVHELLAGDIPTVSIVAVASLTQEEGEVTVQAWSVNPETGLPSAHPIPQNWVEELSGPLVVKTVAGSRYPTISVRSR